MWFDTQLLCNKPRVVWVWVAISWRPSYMFNKNTPIITLRKEATGCIAIKQNSNIANRDGIHGMIIGRGKPKCSGDSPGMNPVLHEQKPMINRYGTWPTPRDSVSLHTQSNNKPIGYERYISDRGPLFGHPYVKMETMKEREMQIKFPSLSCLV
jgi:hypothetical protein